MKNRILVIDDDSAVRKSFLLAMEDTGYGVDTAEDGLSGIEMTRRSTYGMIFLDLKMPGINGVETLRRIRGVDPSIPVFIVTAFHHEFFDELRRVRDEGAGFELLRKPISADQIVAVCRSVLEGEPAVYGNGAVV